MHSKGQYVEKLFASIAPKYDLLNSLLSFGLHKQWRRTAIRECALTPGNTALDVAAGTLELSIMMSEIVGSGGAVTAVDFCVPMLEIGRRKLEDRGIGNVSTVEGNAESLPVESDSFDCAIIGFGLRNVSDVQKTLSEMVRAVKSGGRVVSLELFLPDNRFFARIYEMYFARALPIIGGVVSGDRESYQYLPESVARFRTKVELKAMMESAGLAGVTVLDLTGGVAAVHVGVKP
jgi:demethylmenaquinone methyltransferase/2-methoxy-6-polyprenyl-1,4-benzoquinol methylase